MSGLGNYYRVVLFVLCAFFIDIRVVSAAKIDEFYVHEFLRITESSAIWQTSKFIQQLNEEVQLLADDGLIPSRYRLTDVDSMIQQLDQSKDLDESKKFEVVRQYFSALSDLHYGPTLQANIEPYLIYPEHRQPVTLDANHILNFALLGVDSPSDAFALARPDYIPYLRLRVAFRVAEKYGVLTDDQRLKVQVNLERFRRLSHKVTDQMLLVDIAGAELALYDGGSQPLVQQASQIGRTDRQTPLMWSEVTHITVNPSWTVPPTVYREDMLPQIRRSQRFLEENQIQVLDFDGNPQSPASINWRNPGRILLRRHLATKMS
ncbi:L,D-transpeptidase family protein [Nitrincola sp. A-D6]|uniref:L,D-transpeptidase family protein n=1 Tax=Nitrincola sp. A-D6 TaxID=1545442 RepID=UPI000689E37D|nr:L,D-transpeptidase family protein [Nitrincola sp. A-D6]